MSLLFVTVMGIVEGLTEFLPVSSTGHLILVGRLFGYDDDKAKTFEIFIQLGAILAVAWEYRSPLLALVRRMTNEAPARQFAAKVMLAFLPAAVLGLVFHKTIKAELFNPVGVATALIVGGVAMYLVEQFLPRPAAGEVEQISWGQAIGVGLFQTLSLWPGMSR